MLRTLRPRSIFKRLPRGLSYANVVASMALFVALGGTAYAVNTVRSTDIVDGEVKSVDIGNNEIGSSDVKDGSLNTFDVHSFIGEDVIDGTLTGADVKNRSLGGADIAYDEVTSFNVADDGLTGIDVADNTLSGADISELSGADIVDGSVTGVDVGNGTLKDEDIAKGAFVDFVANIGSIPANKCIWKYISGIEAVNDHLLLTAYFFSAHPDVTYSGEASPTTGAAYLKACNTRAEAVDDGTTAFNLLVIEAQ